MAALLSQQEQALLRGWMNGLGWPLLGKLYLGGADIAAVRAAVLDVRRRLALRARQGGRADLEAFWLGERAAGGAWLARAEAALGALLDGPAPLPSPADPVARWFAGPLARKLESAGLSTLGGLAALRRSGGRFWWRGLPKFGGQSAQAVERFLQAHAAGLGLAGGALQTRQAGSPGSPIADFFADHPGLGGEDGTNRAARERCRLPAANDYEAVCAWLALRERSASTHRLYRKEAERFLLWAVSERGKPLSSLDTLDCKAYRDFLFAPAERWSNPRFKPRWSPGWRPFKGPLSRRNVKLAETVLSSMCEWLVKQRYLDSNPFDGLPPLPAPGPERMQVEHALTSGQWRWLLDYCASCQSSPPAGRQGREYRRIWIALQLAYCTGLRLSEMAAARLGDIVHKTRGGGQYWLAVVGKGGKPREVPLPGELAAELQAYARERGAAWGVPGSPAPVIGKFRKATEDGLDFAETPFSASGLHTVLRGFFKEAAAARRAVGSEEAERDAEALGRATTHWLRHTHASHALQRGAALIHVKENLGHASLSTTSVYLHADKDERHAAMGGLFQK